MPADTATPDPMTGRTYAPDPDHPAVLPPLPQIIDFLAGTDPASWWAGPTFRSPCGTRHCVLAHVETRWGMAGLEEFESLYATSYRIGAYVNDEPSTDYPQEHPKDRVLAYLRAMLDGAEPTTMESLEADAALHC